MNERLPKKRPLGARNGERRDVSSSARAELNGLLEHAGVEPPLRERLAAYGALLLEANRQLNLTGAKSPKELADHLLDSLTVVPYVRDPLIDVGSGGGLPGVPISLATEVAVTLVEATLKKARFLEMALDRLGLRGAIVATRAEVAAHQDALRERFASGTARAIASAPTVAELLLPFIALEGVAILQRGKFDDAERRALEDACLMLGASLEAETPLDDGRRIVVVRKHSVTPARFPRRSGMPEKRPLCYGPRRP